MSLRRRLARLELDRGNARALEEQARRAAVADPQVEAQRELGRESFGDFVRMAWHVVQPNRQFVDGWHIDAICEHLQAVSDGEIRDLILAMPPRHMKSSLVSVLWPAWEWTKNPHVAFLTASYAASLSIRDAVRTRRLISSLWYRERWGGSFALLGDQNAKWRYDNSKGGYRIATSVGGTVTGEGGDVLVVDDAVSVAEAGSEAVRRASLTWWDETWSTRGNDPKTVAKVIVAQRTHENDLTGHCLAKEAGYVYLKLPAEYRGQKNPTPIGFQDPRTTPDELLWPARFGRKEIDKLKLELGTYAASAQLQQEPVPAGGGTFKLEWFGRFGTAPAHGLKTVSIDCANKAKELNNYSVAGAFREHEERAHLVDVWRERVEYPGLKRGVMSFCITHTPDAVLIEDKGNGIALIQDLRQTTRLPIIAIEPEGDKIMRAQRTSPSVEAGLVLLPEFAGWLNEFEQEIGHFPVSDFDDQVDMLTQFLDRFARGTLPGFASVGNRDMSNGEYMRARFG